MKPLQGTYKPLDFGGEGVTGSVDADGRIIALNMLHRQHGYVTLTPADPFVEAERYNAAQVRAYRASLAGLQGFGLRFAEAVTRREAYLLESAVPFIRLMFDNGGEATVTTLANASGVAQIWEMRGVQPVWEGRLCLQRCAYTQLTEGGPVRMPPLRMHISAQADALHIENPMLPAAVVMRGLEGLPEETHEVEQPLTLRLECAPSTRVVLVYGVGENAAAADEQARRLQQRDASAWLGETLARWRGYWEHTADDPVLRRGLVYGEMLAIPVGEGMCFLTDHMLLPLSWNRDAYYVARALLSWHPAMADVVRRHLLWMFEMAERHEGAWGRCYLANGRIKDGAFQLDQQLFPLLELVDYVEQTGDRALMTRLKPHVEALLDMLMLRRSADSGLFPTDETPADDPIAFPYHLSSHLLLLRVLMKLKRVGLAEAWATVADELRDALPQHFIAAHGERRLYAYATDGAGHHHFYHDANDLPLVLAPLWGILSANDPAWQATMAFAFSEDNEGGAYGGRLGSVHTRAAWPLGDVQDWVIAQLLCEPDRERRALAQLRSAAQWDGALPEASDPQSAAVVSRHWFAWPNAAFACVWLHAFES
ncbi:MAG: glycoside hydrolase family 125 protein [Anaerolineae bacterium]|nr:glycoside hydrolase family 125 protein [Anaerolineae bacterium]